MPKQIQNTKPNKKDQIFKLFIIHGFFMHAIARTYIAFGCERFYTKLKEILERNSTWVLELEIGEEGQKWKHWEVVTVMVIVEVLMGQKLW